MCVVQVSHRRLIETLQLLIFIHVHLCFELQLVNSIPFFNYNHERSIPFRACDFFDELVARFASNPEEFDGKSNQLFSRPHIQELAEELLNLVSE